jgi:hypothetical protein
MVLRVCGTVFAGAIFAASASAAEVERIADAGDYFPDTPGSQWRYRGEIHEGPLQTIARKTFMNVSSVKGTENVKGVTVKVFHDTNPGNHGPSDSYYRRDSVGIVYYGSEPGTTLEKQLIPYQIVRFPIEVPSSFEQFDRRGLNFGTDIDGDDKNERADMQALVVVTGKEDVTVPAGSYQGAVKIEARMTMRIHMTKTGRSAEGTDIMTAWFAKGVGLVKYVERQELPPLRSDRGMVTEITEELESFSISPRTSALP